jgi:hypothetical protein
MVVFVECATAAAAAKAFACAFFLFRAPPLLDLWGISYYCSCIISDLVF